MVSETKIEKERNEQADLLKKEIMTSINTLCVETASSVKHVVMRLLRKSLK
jgi:hypothetical protein